METLYPVHEMFHSFQGEGANMGISAFFVRMFGCPVQCPWCDSAGTWHRDYVPSAIARRTAVEILQAYEESGAPMMVVTGGEPLIHNLEPLLVKFSERFHGGGYLAIETSGAFPLQLSAPIKEFSTFAWFTVSPKRWKIPTRENLLLANEFKFIIERPDDIRYYTELVSEISGRLPSVPVWLHPEWSKRNDPEVLAAIVLAVKANGDMFRAGYQLHKIYQADSRDNRSVPPVPLGGNPALGL